MKRTLKLRTDGGYDVRIILENWGSGLDRSRRRWILQDSLWQCMDSGDFAEERVFGFRKQVARYGSPFVDVCRTSGYPSIAAGLLIGLGNFFAADEG
jgi:hypothetical protein